MKKIFNIYAGIAVFILVLMGIHFEIPIINETIPEAMWFTGNCFFYFLGIANKFELSGLHPVNVIFGVLIFIYIVICFCVWAERNQIK
ncbi:hypothetical protein [Sulfurospirillum multivorans]|uniref:Membrane protein n=2 Tax=Sulfurospirillum multivorans TaxID=66821 RepID=A0AA86ALZ9_SULMK|nr:hypothetical protein [Sulfurospirillum multivorans]AHJ13111.1 putative membrane protein [Sulfurospirillum multivorans DSM 12446]QEH06599.1 putative membrane protein [Sulfurospirillum multivorans]